LEKGKSLSLFRFCEGGERGGKGSGSLEAKKKRKKGSPDRGSTIAAGKKKKVIILVLVRKGRRDREEGGVAGALGVALVGGGERKRKGNQWPYHQGNQEKRGDERRIKYPGHVPRKEKKKTTII